MSARFVAASSQFLRNAAPPFTGPPFSIGCWFTLTATAGGGSLVNFNNGLAYVTLSIEAATFRYVDSVTNFIAFGDSTMLNRPYYCVLRIISTANQKCSILQPDGSIATMATAGLITGAVTQIDLAINTLFATYADVNISELFYTATDIQPDGLALNNSTLYQLAYRGPFSIPALRKDIIEYRSFRQHPTTGRPNDIFSGGRGIQTWTNTGGVTTGPHVPISSTYTSPVSDDNGIVTLAFPVDEGDATVTVTGSPIVGSTLTATFNNDDPDGPATAGPTYQWRQDATSNIASATNSTYVPVAGDIGHTLDVLVTYTDADGFAETITSSQTASVTGAATGIDTKGLSIGKGLSPFVGLSKGKGLSWRTGV